jgi:hypothetical protein
VVKPETITLEIHSIPIQEFQQAKLIRECLEYRLNQNVDLRAWKNKLQVNDSDWSEFLHTFSDAFTRYGALNAMKKLRQSGEQFEISGSHYGYVVLDIVEEEAYRANGTDRFLTIIKLYDSHLPYHKLGQARNLWSRRRDYRYERGEYQNPSVQL